VTDNGQVFHINTKGYAAVKEPIRLSDEAEARAQQFIARYPQPRSAVMPLLYLAQEEVGFINQQAVEWVAQKISLPPVQVWEVATFYTMYYKKPVGRYHIQVCRTLPCALQGAKKISQFVHARLGLQPGEVSSDGMWSFEEVECLGSCGTAPMCQINDHFFENLTEEKLDQLLTRIQQEQPDLKLSTVKDDMGPGLSGYPKSQIIES
jgi:NADH-quinone oxidoreductase E subunit